jgi:hypothetical protein
MELYYSAFRPGLDIEDWVRELIGTLLKSLNGEKLWAECWTNKPVQCPHEHCLNVEFPCGEEHDLDDFPGVLHMATAAEKSPRY